MSKRFKFIIPVSDEEFPEMKMKPKKMAAQIAEEFASSELEKAKVEFQEDWGYKSPMVLARAIVQSARGKGWKIRAFEHEGAVWLKREEEKE